MALWRLWPHRRRQWLPLRRSLLMLGAPAEPAAAARRPAWPQAPWGDLFGERRRSRAERVRRVAVPLPKPRPAEAPMRGIRQARAEKPAARKAGACRDRQAGRAGRQPRRPPPSACRLALTEAIAIAPSIPDIKGAGGCGGEDLVRLEAMVLPDKRQVSVKPAAILRCTMASAIADWIRTDIAPLAAEPRQRHQRSRQFRLVRMPRPQPCRRRHAVRAWPRQCARRSRA